MTDSRDMTVTDLLRRQHEQVRSMFDALDMATGGARVEVFDCLRAFLAVHETAEEEVVHPFARTRGPDADRVVRMRLDEENQAKRMLSDLEKIGPDGDGFDDLLVPFRAAVLAHADAEEREVFPLLEAHEDTELLRRMSSALVVAEQLAPTHPHPHSPETAIGNMLTGPMVAIVDRVRDAIKKAA